MSEKNKAPSNFCTLTEPRALSKAFAVRLAGCVFLLTCFVLWTNSAHGETKATKKGLRTNDLIYQNPFDLSAGGASLTKATQEGVLFSNPSLPALGSGFLRWIFARTTLHVGADAVDVARNPPKTSAEITHAALKTPIYAGMDVAGGMITSNISGGVFGSMRADIEGREFGSQGMPEVRTRSYAYAGAIGALSKEFADTLAIGAAVRYQGNGEVYRSFGLSETQDILNELKKSMAVGYGMGVDLGMTLQYRTSFFDLRWALTANDVGDTQFKTLPKVGPLDIPGDLSPWKQTVNTGVGITLHDKESAVHCSADLRDLERSYGEHWTRRAYAGCKALFRSRFGFGVGYYQGWPTYGVILNLVLIRLEAGSYTKELGEQAATQGRRVYFFAIGAEVP